MQGNEITCILDARIDLANQCYHIAQSAYPALQGTMPRDDFRQALINEDILYYVDREKILTQLNWQSLMDDARAHGESVHYFRVNTASGVKWVTAKTTPAQGRASDHATQPSILHIVIKTQGISDFGGATLDEADLRELLFDGLGAACLNLIMVDVMGDQYRMFNAYGNIINQEMEAPCKGSYTEDNAGYATNLIYEADKELFLQHTSLDWYRSHLLHKGDQDAFKLRHLCNEEYRWVNVHTVCTRRDEESFHVLFWVTDAQESPTNEGTLAMMYSELIGQFRWERRTGHTPRLIVGDSYKSMTGLGSEPTPEDTYNEYFKRIVPEDWPKYHAYFASLRDNGDTPEELTYRWIHPVKGLRYFRGRATCLAHTQDYTCYRGYQQDVTDVVQAQIEQQAKLSEALTAAERANNAKSDFLSKLSHDIRTPLNAILGFTDLLEKHGDDPQRRADYIDKIKDSGNVLLTLINNILEMAHLENGDMPLQMRRINIVRQLTSADAVLGEYIERKNLHFERHLDIQHPSVLCDLAKLNEVFLSLLSNAVKYTPEGGHITFTMTETPVDREGWALYTTRISDDGVGMSQEFLPQLFQRFSRERTDVTQTINGAGLGTAIVRQLMDIMGGTVSVESELGHGTTFTVALELQYAAAEHEGDLDANLASMQETFAGKRVLLAEDNDLNAEIAIEILTDLGLAVDRAINGETCVQMVQQAEPNTYGLVFMDLQMPVMTGFEATRAIRQLDAAHCHIPIVAMTANALDTDRMHAFDAGMDAFVTKPIMVDEIEAVLQKFLG